jgi:hypothetical protein
MSHVIHVSHDVPDEGRSHWECDCGAAGSAPTERVEIAAEKHVDSGEMVTYRWGASPW